MVDADTPFKCFININLILSKDSEVLNKVQIIKTDIEWFNNNKERIINLFRSKFYETIKVQDNKQMTKYFEFFNEQGSLLDEVKNFSNKILKDLMSETFFKNIISTLINSVNPIDLVGDNIISIRKELKLFFASLSKWTSIIKNLGDQLNKSLSRKDLVLYEELLEADGLKGIYYLYSDKVQSSISQIIQKIKQNEKFANALNYFIKDFLFFYFCIRNFALRNRVLICINELKQMFLERYMSIINENISRALNLIISLRKVSFINECKLILLYIISSLQYSSRLSLNTLVLIFNDFKIVFFASVKQNV